MSNYSVNEWLSHPDDDNDDCITGQDFDTLAEALKAFEGGSFDREACFVEIDGPDINRVRKVREPARVDRDEWRREIAREEGMLGGCGAYNEVMGY
jgi:hypothetical protein